MKHSFMEPRKCREVWLGTGAMLFFYLFFFYGMLLSFDKMSQLFEALFL